MFKRLLAIAILIPLVDSIVLAFVASQVLGWVPTVLLVVLTGFVGVLLVQSEGRHTLRRMNEAVYAGRIPTDELLDGAFLIAAGAFLLTPGLVTDAIGLLFALPPTRYPLREALKRWVVTPYLDEKTGGLVTGRIYTSGFPNDGSGGVTWGAGGGPGPDDGGSGAAPGPKGGFEYGREAPESDVYDVDADVYEIDIEERGEGETD